MIRRPLSALALLALGALAGCGGNVGGYAPAPEPALPTLTAEEAGLPPMRSFGPARALPVTRSNRTIAADILALSFALESGQSLPRFTRFEEPVTVALVGANGQTTRDLDALLARLRREAGIDIRRSRDPASAAVVIEEVPRRALMQALPDAACFVVPGLRGWEAFATAPSIPSWSTLERRETVSIFLPRDASPQEHRDCLHEELAQALGPLNDLWHLRDSTFNDDNFHTILTGFDMLVLRALYDPAIRSGMSEADMAAALPAVLARIHPQGGPAAPIPRAPKTRRDWARAISAALSPSRDPAAQRAAAARALRIARAEGWIDNRLALSLYTHGALSIPVAPETALTELRAAYDIYAANPATAIHAAHVQFEFAALALSAGKPDETLVLSGSALPVAERAQDAALLASNLFLRAEALWLTHREAEARSTRQTALGWARYGLGAPSDILRRMEDITALTPERPAP